MTEKTEAKLNADKRHDEKRKTYPRLPGTRLPKPEDGKTMDKLYKKYNGDKTKAILTAAKFDLENNK